MERSEHPSSAFSSTTRQRQACRNLKCPRRLPASIAIIRAFVKMRELLASHKDLAARVEKLEATRKKHGSIIGILAEEIYEMKRIPEPPKRRIGFKTNP